MNHAVTFLTCIRQNLCLNLRGETDYTERLTSTMIFPSPYGNIPKYLYNTLCTVNTQHTSRQDAIITVRLYLATCFGRDRPSSGQLRTILRYSKNRFIASQARSTHEYKNLKIKILKCCYYFYFTLILLLVGLKMAGNGRNM